MRITLSWRNAEDGWTWSRDPKGIFTVKSCIDLFTVKEIVRLILGCLPTADQLILKHIPVNGSCPVCQNAAETGARCLKEGDVVWTKPSDDRLKVNIDAAVFSAKKKLGLGCLIRNSEEHFVMARCSSVPGLFSPTEAEL
ncbi:conserved hypothetical protein [Ricinus communis]|uniref:RNase H type-1 domain-containing protein n=1 Tax=Ricinus communis TaxID=3988 RepID=B9SBZ7_RICCO|nr:conserved hypothetical protein [Ricinus communis]